LPPRGGSGTAKVSPAGGERREAVVGERRETRDDGREARDESPARSRTCLPLSDYRLSSLAHRLPSQRKTARGRLRARPRAGESLESEQHFEDTGSPPA